jgi:hypothetical protein
MDVPVSLAQNKNPAAQTGVDSRIDEIISLRETKRRNPPGIRRGEESIDHS